MTRRAFIVGAPKSATSSLHNWLVQHPGVYNSPIKETHFFTHEHVERTYYKPARVVKSQSAYDDLFREAEPDQILLDSTPNYLLYKGTAQKIRDAYPEAKLIAILRDPFERAISHFKMDRVLGIHNEPQRNLITMIENNPLFRLEYLENSRYGSNLEQYDSVFPNDQMCVLDFERLKRDSAAVLSEVFSFLGIYDCADTVDVAPQNTHNPAAAGYHRLLRKAPFLSPIARSLPEGLKNALKSIYRSKKTFHDDTTEEEMVRVKHEFMGLIVEDLRTLTERISWTSKFTDDTVANGTH